MQPTNQPRTQKSRCMYCGSTDRGRGCRYAPHGVHFHQNDSTKCAYCGSPDYGKGCKLNPTSNLHIHGISFNSMVREGVQSFLDNKVFINEIKKEFKDFDCYKLKIIDEQGNKIRQPVTEQEQASYSPMVRTILRIKRMMGSKVELLETLNDVDTKIVSENSADRYERLLEFKDQVNDVVDKLYCVLEKAKSEGFKLEEIKKLIQA